MDARLRRALVLLNLARNDRVHIRTATSRGGQPCRIKDIRPEENAFVTEVIEMPKQETTWPIDRVGTIYKDDTVWHIIMKAY